MQKKPPSRLVNWIHAMKRRGIMAGYIKRDTRPSPTPEQLNQFGFEVAKNSRAAIKDRVK